MEVAVEEVAETDRSKGGHAERAGVGEMDGEGDESLVIGGEADKLRSSAVEGLGVIVIPGGCRVADRDSQWLQLVDSNLSELKDIYSMLGIKKPHHRDRG